jgi:outer membrane receptor protein involved in Fe transport
MGVLLSSFVAYAQEQTTISGTIKDKDTGQPITGANIAVQDKPIGTTSDASGKFKFKTTEARPLVVVVSFVGFKTQFYSINLAEMYIDAELETAPIYGNEVVITASRVEESIMKIPSSVEKLEYTDLQSYGALGYYDAISNMRGVDVVSSGLNFRTYNTRGFNSTQNNRFLTTVDGVDMAMPSLNIGFANFMGVSELDMESLEVTSGPASALYGLNAFNGMMALKTKDPFTYQGLSAMVRGGMNHVDGFDNNTAFLGEGAIRFAKSFKDRIAFKVNGSYFQGVDWYATNNINMNNPLLGSLDDPRFDGLNIYGDEVTGRIRNIIDNRDLTVTRTGYQEKDLTDYTISNFKADFSVHARVTQKITASYTYRIGGGSGIYTGMQRYQLRNLHQQQHIGEVKGKNFFVRSYYSFENTDDSYDLTSTAATINNNWKSNSLWFFDYQNEFNNRYTGNNAPLAHRNAREAADKGRLVPGSQQFDDELMRARKTVGGNRFGSNLGLYSAMAHTEGMYNFSHLTKRIVEVQVGGHYRYYGLNTEGRVFPDSTNNEISLTEYGGYLQLQKSLLSNKALKLVGSIRYDKNAQIEEGRFTPRAAILYTLKRAHTFRVMYQTGFRMPSPYEFFVDENFGRFTFVGGLPGIYNRYNPNRPDAYTLSSVREYATLIENEVNSGLDPRQALQSTSFRETLRNHQFTTLKPEFVTSYELGYKGLFNNRFFFDLSGYYNEYENFIGAKLIATPSIDGTVDPGGDVQNLVDGFYRVYGIYANSKAKVQSYGGSGSFGYTTPHGYHLLMNYSVASFDLGTDRDDLVAPFNTPRHRTNVSFGNRNLYKNVGINATWRWQDAVEWSSVFASGTVPAYNTFDLQLSYRLPSFKSLLKVGANNILNTRFQNFYGGPTVGAIYYVSLTFDQMMK